LLQCNYVLLYWYFQKKCYNEKNRLLFTYYCRFVNDMTAGEIIVIIIIIII